MIAPIISKSKKVKTAANLTGLAPSYSDANRSEQAASVVAIRERMVAGLTQVDALLAKRVADGLGLVSVTPPPVAFEHLLLTDTPVKDNVRSIENARKDSVIGRRVAILVANHVDGAVISSMSKALQAGGASIKIIAPWLGEVMSYEGHNYKGEHEGKPIKVDHSLATVSPALFDAVFIPGGQLSAGILCKDANAVLFVKEAYKHGKAIGACDEGVILLTKAAQFVGTLDGEFQAPDVITCEGDKVDNAFIKRFVAAVAQHRFTERTDLESIVA